MSIFPGDVKVYRSNDSLEENEHQYPIEFLYTLCLSGMPRAPNTLQLKKHSSIILLRNLDPVKCHCNGTRYVIEHLHDLIIDATIACGPRAGKQIFILRIAKSTGSNAMPCRHLFETGFLFTWATLRCHEPCRLKRQPQNLFRPWSIYQQFGLQRSPASVSMVSHTITGSVLVLL